MADGKSAADANKAVDACFQENQKVVANACLIDSNLPISHLATAVWAHGNQKIRTPEAPMSRDRIADEKLQIFGQVSQSCEKLIPKITNADKKKMIDQVKSKATYK